jgi:chromosome partition protein MukE
MSKAEYALLQDVIMDADFPDLDLALRRGRHVDRDDAGWYSLLTDAQELLEPFYRRYGCELIHKTDGYFYLLPTGDKVSRKQLAATDMLVGQALALLYLDPAAVERGGVVTQEEVVSQLSAVLGSDALIGVFSPGKRKAKDERIAQRNVRQRVGEAMRRLAVLGFVELSEENAVRLRAALLRFAEPVRGLSEPAEALAKLVAQGEVALAPDDLDAESDSDEARESVEEEPDRTTLVGVPAPDLGVAGFRGVVADGSSAAADVKGAAGVSAVGARADSDVADESAVQLERDDVPPRGFGSERDAATVADDVESRSAIGASESGADRALAERDDDVAARRADAVDLSADDSERAGVSIEALASERAERDLAELDAAHAEDDMADTLAGIGAPSVSSDDELADDAADGGEIERSAVVRKPRGPVSRDDLDWADIVVPEPDVEDGS